MADSKLDQGTTITITFIIVLFVVFMAYYIVRRMTALHHASNIEHDEPIPEEQQQPVDPDAEILKTATM